MCGQNSFDFVERLSDDSAIASPFGGFETRDGNRFLGVVLSRVFSFWIEPRQAQPVSARGSATRTDRYPAATALAPSSHPFRSGVCQNPVARKSLEGAKPKNGISSSVATADPPPSPAAPGRAAAAA